MSLGRTIAALLVVAAWVATMSTSAPGQLLLNGAKPKPPVAPTEKNIKAAIQHGVKYLRSSADAGSVYEAIYPAGCSALIGLALLEAGVGADDPFVQQTAQLIRKNVRNFTYELALSILFLDRLGQKEDSALIRSLAMRVIAGQNSAGGWTYGCPSLSAEQEEQLLAFLRKNQPLRDPLRPVEHAFLVPLGKPGSGPLASPLPKPGVSLTDPLNTKDKLPKLLTPFPKNDAPDRKPLSGNEGPLRKPAETPEPATPALPKAKNDKSPLPAGAEKPADPASSAASDKPAPGRSAKPAADEPSAKPASSGKPVRIDPADWPSVPDFVAREITKRGGRDGFPHIEVDDNSNTQFAILALWAARRHDVPMALSLAMLDRRFRNSQLASGAWAYNKSGAVFSYDTMTCVGLLALGVSHGSFREVMRVDGKQLFADPAVQKGLQALGRTLRTPSREPPNAYLLWSLERVAVLYDLKKIDQQDWYVWGARALLRTQNADGSWNAHHAHGMNLTVNTAMNVLFLARSHLNRDLTDQLKGFLQVK
jgi:hypothetical protein